MTREELQAYLHTHIPLSAAMQVEVLAADEHRVELQAPLAPNINHRGTAFGGSISTLATLACWSLLRVRTDALPVLPHLVVARNSVKYLQPVEHSFSAIAQLPAEADWPALLQALETRGRARLSLQAEVHCEGKIAALFEGDFVALAR